MADLTITKTYADGASLTKAKLDTSFDSISTYINARNTGTAWDSLAVTGTSTFTGQITVTGGIANILGYRRPTLTWISATTVDVENNTGTSNQTTIVFPDGTLRSVTEDTSSAHKYRRFLITATAEFTSGTEDSGLYTGLSEETNTWYAIYAVKSTVDATKFVLVGNKTLPIRANFATLNSNLGTNGWVYLGMIRNGDNVSATGDIIKFFQSGGQTRFQNVAGDIPGTRLAAGSNVVGSVGLSYTYAAGTGTTEIPNHIKLATIVFYGNDGSSGSYQASDNPATTIFGSFTATASITPGDKGVIPLVLPVGIDYLLTTNIASCDNLRINLAGWFDPVLASGINPIL